MRVKGVLSRVQMSQALRENTYPFLAMIVLRDHRMTVVGRLEGLMEPDTVLLRLQQIMVDNEAALITARMERQGIKQEEAFCTICNTIINCAQHGVAAVKRHAANKSHVELCTQHRDASGVLKKPATKQVQLESCFATGPGLSEADRAARADTYFALGVALSGIPYIYGDVATKMMPSMFPDSKIAKEFQCGRKKLSYIISDGLGPYFKKAVTDELNRPHTYYTIQIDETPLPEQRCQQLDVMARYFSETQKRVVVEHLRSYHLGSATTEILLAHVKEALQDLPARNMPCFYSDGPNVMRSLKKRLKEDVNPALLDIGECSLHKVLKDLKSIHPSAVKEESAIVALRNLAQQVPEVVPPQEVSALMDELTLLSTEEFSSNPHERLDDAWQHIFSLLSKDGGPKYPRTVKFVKAMLSLAHGNADVERGFSENRRLLHERSNLSIASVNGLRATKSFCSRYGQDASAVSLKPDMIKAVKGSFKKYQERVSAECEPSAKKAKLHQDSVGSKVDEQRSIQMDIDSAKKMLANAELLIAKGMKAKKFDDIESGQALLKEGQAKLASSLSKLEDSKKKKSCARL
ncbi:hypothetical protein HPB51_001721 [Rhipicephalus microplus]|uniref:Uncharacterized protein n=1 Tax=Rhipicephalus microplus TaxID=6941 RepID=A0A9J6DE74_RHIMP|nr:hypothetical protein HPB51_001721 [Rhipicephalus microplus]